MTALDTMKKYYQNRAKAAGEWKKKGGKVVGYLCDNVPEELILAAGFFPLRLSGDPRDNTDEADKYLISAYEGFSHSTINMLLTGKYDFVDYLIIPHARDSIHEMYGRLRAIKSLKLEIKLPELYLLDNLHTKFYLSGLYNRDRIIELKHKLEEWSGKIISDSSLSRAIEIGNENKLLLKQIAALRVREKPVITGVEALQIIGSSMFMLKEDHNKLLREILSGENKLYEHDGIRLFVEGSPMDNSQFYEIVESCNAVVVAEDNCWGNRYSDVLVQTTIDPFEAIAERYHQKSPCPRMYPISVRVNYCISNAEASKAQGVIFNILQCDFNQTWETVDEIEILQKKGIPFLHLKEQPYFIANADSLKASLNSFIKSIVR